MNGLFRVMRKWKLGLQQLVFHLQVKLILARYRALKRNEQVPSRSARKPGSRICSPIRPPAVKAQKWDDDERFI
jgi:hypothetical protein